MSAEPPTLRELRRERATAEIAAAAFDLFQEHGYDQTTVEQIAEAALVSPRTFYNYFASKEDVLFSEADAGVAPFRSQVLAQTPTDGPYAAVRAACLTVADVIDSGSAVYLPRLRLIATEPALEARDRRTDKGYVEAIVAGLTSRGRPTVATRRRAAFIAAATVGGLNEAVATWVRCDGRPSLRTLVEELFEALEPLYL